jgi:hypothetical protein
MCCTLLTISSLPLFGGTVTITLFSDTSAAPGAIFEWQFMLTNSTGFDLFPSDVQSTFPSFDTFAANFPAVSPDLDAFNLQYPDGLGSGSTSALLPFAQYLIATGATPGTTVGGGSCCTLTLSYDLFSGAAYQSSSSVDSALTSVVISSSEIIIVPPDSSVPEPRPAVITLLGLAALAVRRISARKRT